jgi:hypothetical protein
VPAGRLERGSGMGGGSRDRGVCGSSDTADRCRRRLRRTGLSDGSGGWDTDKARASRSVFWSSGQPAQSLLCGPLLVNVFYRAIPPDDFTLRTATRSRSRSHPSI